MNILGITYIKGRETVVCADCAANLGLDVKYDATEVDLEGDQCAFCTQPWVDPWATTAAGAACPGTVPSSEEP